MRLNYLLVFIPIAIVLRFMGANPVWVFLASALAIVLLAGLMGEATEHLAHYLGPTIGGLLNASLGNAPEVIIAILALKNGLVDVVKASITGSRQPAAITWSVYVHWRAETAQADFQHH